MTVLVGYIPTPEGQAALNAAILESRARNTALVVLNASNGDALVDKRHANQDVMAELDRMLAQDGVEHTMEHRSGKDPVDEILALAEQPDVDLVVIGLRRRSAVGKLLLGSSAQRILLGAPCPVLAVKAGS